MTFVKTRLRLLKPLAATDYEKLSHLSTKYGIRGLSIDGEDLVVEYDGSRLHEAEVSSVVHEAGIAAGAVHPIPQGSFDHSGEFKDFAWPLTGLSPANQKQK